MRKLLKSLTIMAILLGSMTFNSCTDEDKETNAAKETELFETFSPDPGSDGTLPPEDPCDDGEC